MYELANELHAHTRPIVPDPGTVLGKNGIISSLV